MADANPTATPIPDKQRPTDGVSFTDNAAPEISSPSTDPDSFPPPVCVRGGTLPDGSTLKPGQSPAEPPGANTTPPK